MKRERDLGGGEDVGSPRNQWNRPVEVYFFLCFDRPVSHWFLGTNVLSRNFQEAFLPRGEPDVCFHMIYPSLISHEFSPAKAGRRISRRENSWMSDQGRFM